MSFRPVESHAGKNDFILIIVIYISLFFFFFSFSFCLFFLLFSFFSFSFIFCRYNEIMTVAEAVHHSFTCIVMVNIDRANKKKLMESNIKASNVSAVASVLDSINISCLNSVCVQRTKIPCIQKK